MASIVEVAQVTDGAPGKLAAPAPVARAMPEWSETTAQVLKSHGVSEKSGLSASQVARLEALGMVWDV